MSGLSNFNCEIARTRQESEDAEDEVDHSLLCPIWCVLNSGFTNCSCFAVVDIVLSYVPSKTANTEIAVSLLGNIKS